jgi:uncharacterized protein YdaU (DUF1376 family)
MNSHTGGMTYARFFPSDWRTGCLVLNLEEEGLYIRCCAYMYDTGKCIPSDDHQASRVLNVQFQKYVKVMTSLIDKGKMIRGQGWIINERVMEEIDKYRAEHAARSAAAKARELTLARKRQQIAEEIEKTRRASADLGGVPPHQPPHQPRGGSPGGTSKYLGEVLGEVTPENSNEIKRTGTTAVPQGHHGSGTNPESRSQKPEEERKKDTTTTGAESEAARGGGGSYLDALNGTAIDMTAFIARHVGGNLDEDEARRMLATNIKTFGAEAMMEAYSLTVAEMASGLLGKPYKYLIETARKLKDGRAPKAKADQPSKSEQRQARAARISAELQAEKAGRAQQ